MKTRVASVVLDTHAEDITSVADAAESGDSSLANSAASFTTHTYSENISMYDERTGSSLNVRFGTSSVANSIYRQTLSDHMADVDTTIFSDAGRLHKLQAISDDLSEYWDKSQLHLPRNNVFWNQDAGSAPGGAQNGDIWWDIPGQKNSRDFSRAVPRKYKNGQWIDISFQKEFFGSEIYGGKVQGGKIIGVNFEAQTSDGKGEAVFHVTSDGKLHAQNFNADILLSEGNASGHNPRSYRGGFTDGGQGFFLEDGIFQMKAWAKKQKFDSSDFGQQEYYAQTFIEPNGLKQRAYNSGYTGVDDVDSGTLIARTDVRSGRIDINDKWSDETGFTARPTEVRVGKYIEEAIDDSDPKYGIVKSHYMNTNSLHVQGTGLTIDKYDGNTTLTNKGISEFQGTIHAKNGIVIDGGTLSMDGKIVKNNGSNENIGNGFTTHGTITLSGFGANVDIQNGNLVADQGIYTRNGIKIDKGNLEMNNGNGNPGAIAIFNVPWVQASNSLSVHQTFQYARMEVWSDRSLKKNFETVDSGKILSNLVATDIVKYNYKDPNNKDADFFGPVIDDVDNEKKYYVPEDLVSRYEGEKHNTLITNNYISYLALGIKELAKQNQELMFRLAKLEREGK